MNPAQFNDKWDKVFLSAMKLISVGAEKTLLIIPVDKCVCFQ